jgi:hypothetical protein
MRTTILVVEYKMTNFGGSETIKWNSQLGISKKAELLLISMVTIPYSYTKGAYNSAIVPLLVWHPS